MGFGPNDEKRWNLREVTEGCEEGDEDEGREGFIERAVVFIFRRKEQVLEFG